MKTCPHCSAQVHRASKISIVYECRASKNLRSGTVHRSVMCYEAEILELRSSKQEDEKQQRIYYQEIVYAVCNHIDSLRGPSSPAVMCGTASQPSTEVQEAIKRMTFRAAS